MNKKITNGQTGFTIIEVIVVVAVIGILIGIGIGSFASTQNRTIKEEAKVTADKVKLVLDKYFSEKDRYPRAQSTVVNYLNSKGDTETATLFNDTSVYTYSGTTAEGATTCTETGGVRCERYTITIHKTAWDGADSEADIVVTP